MYTFNYHYENYICRWTTTIGNENLICLASSELLCSIVKVCFKNNDYRVFLSRRKDCNCILPYLGYLIFFRRLSTLKIIFSKFFLLVSSFCFSFLFFFFRTSRKHVSSISVWCSDSIRICGWIFQCHDNIYKYSPQTTWDCNVWCLCNWFPTCKSSLFSFI